MQNIIGSLEEVWNDEVQTLENLRIYETFCEKVNAKKKNSTSSEIMLHHCAVHMCLLWVWKEGKVCHKGSTVIHGFNKFWIKRNKIIQILCNTQKV